MVLLSVLIINVSFLYYCTTTTTTTSRGPFVSSEFVVQERASELSVCVKASSHVIIAFSVRYVRRRIDSS